MSNGWRPCVGDAVRTPIGNGEVIGIASYAGERKWRLGAGEFDAPYIVRLNDGRMRGFGFDDLHPSGGA